MSFKYKVVMLVFILMVFAAINSFAQEDPFAAGSPFDDFSQSGVNFDEISSQVFEQEQDNENSDSQNNQSQAVNDESGFNIGGYLKNETYIFIFEPDDLENGDIAKWGNFLELRLKFNWEITPGLNVHVEPLVRGSYGIWSLLARYQAWGMQDIMADYEDDISSMSSMGYDFLHQETIDQAYIEFSAWRFSFIVGRHVIRWGMGYFLNAIDKVNNPNFLNPEDQYPGTTGVSISINLWQDTSIEAYAAFEDRSHHTFAFLEDSQFRKIPFGVEFLTGFAGITIGTGFIREVFYDMLNEVFIETNYVFIEGFTDLWIFGFYFEGICKVHPLDTEAGEEIGFDDIFEGLAGLDYMFTDGTSIRLEYYRQGRGEHYYEDYNVWELLSYDKSLLAKDYLMLYIEKGFMGKLNLTLGAVLNINDLSFGFFPMISYDLYQDLEITLGGYVMDGRHGTEFDGHLDAEIFPGYSQELHYIQHMIYCRIKAYF